MSGLIHTMRAANFNRQNIAKQFKLEEAKSGLEIAPVLKAATLGLLSTLKSLLAEGADVNTRYGRDEISVLGAAALMGHLEIMRALIEHGVDVNGVSSSGETALYRAVIYGRPDLLVDVIALLLSAGAYIDARTTQGSTPLYSAAEYGLLAATRALLAAGADATLRANGAFKEAPLDVAARLGRVEVVRELVRHGVDLDASPRLSGFTALYHAVFSNQAGVVETLVEAGASVTVQAFRCDTLTHFAATHLSPQITLALLRHGAPVQALQGDGVGPCNEQPLHVAARKGGMEGAAEVVDLLLRWGADESELNRGGKTAVQVVGDTADADRVRELLANAPADRAWRRRGLLLLCLARNRSMRISTRVAREGKGEGEGKGALAKGSGGSGGGSDESGDDGGTEQCGDDVGVVTAETEKGEKMPTKVGGGRARLGVGAGGGSAGGGGGGGGGSGGGDGGSPEKGCDLTGVVVSMVEFEQEGFFRTIVRYL